MVRGPLPALLTLVLSCWSASTPAAARAQAQAQPQAQASAPPSPEAVNAAIDRGVAFLLRNQNRDGSWGVDIHERNAPWHDKRDGSCALALFTLLKCGFPPDHPALRRALAFLLESEPRHTYASGIQLHALGALHDPAQKKRMEELLATLLDLRESAGWDYPGLGRPDLSNTQVAALGLRAAHEAGLKLPKTIWGDLVQIVLRHQEEPQAIPGTELLPKEKRRMAGFAYEPGGVPSASMTTAGLTILGIAMEDPARVDHRFDVEITEAQQLGLNWLEQHYSVEGNPAGDVGWHFYYLYGLERVGAFSGLTHIGGHDWYQDGAARLLAEQRPDGAWRTDGRTLWPVAPMETPNTCFALLFLRKATVSGSSHHRQTLFTAESKDARVWVRVDAKQSWTLWVSGFPGAKDLAVERVEWWIDGERVAEVAGDPARAWKDERYALKFQPKKSGTLSVECRVRAHDTTRGPLELRSTPLAVQSELVLEPWMMDYARDAAKSLFTGKEIAVAVSSVESEFHHEGYLLDGLQGSQWWAKEDDTAPWVRLENEKGIRIAELWFSPAAANESLEPSCAKIETVEIRLNGDKDALVVALDPDPRLKTKFVLPKPTLVRKLEIAIPGGSKEKGKCVGLAEIEAR